LNTIVDIFYNTPVITDFKKLDDNFLKVMSKFVLDIDSVDFSSTDSIKSSIVDICDNLGIKIGKVMPGLRMALVGGISGPDLMTTMFILGKDSTSDRINKSIKDLVIY
jgi:glutamyl/glutaminyl-tRNA synthetase